MPDPRPAALAAALRGLATLVESLDGVGLDDLLSGRRPLSLAPREPERPAPTRGPTGRAPGPSAPAGPATRSGQKRSVSAQQAAAAHTALVAMSSRAEARRYLNSFGTVPRLTALADALHIPHLARELRGDLIDKIVNATVGVRLDTESMRGTPPNPVP